jgi:signal peptidase I
VAAAGILVLMAEEKSKPPPVKRDTKSFDPALNPQYANIPAEAEQLSGSERFLHIFWEIAKTIAIIVLAAVLIRAFLIKPFFVQGESMEPNFHDGDYLLVNQISYRLHKPQRGDVIVFDAPPEEGTNYIKRIIAVPGETVDLQNGRFTVRNDKHKGGVVLPEPYVHEGIYTQSSGDQTHWEVAEDEYFAVGDNREPGKSLDTRSWGPLPKDKIIGKVWMRAYPLQDIGIVKHQEFKGLSGEPLYASFTARDPVNVVFARRY